MIAPNDLDRFTDQSVHGATPMQAQKGNTMETRTYTERSNARRAAKAAGVNPDLVVEGTDGFYFPAANDQTATDTNLDIPPEFRRPALTREQEDALNEKTRRANSPDRIIVMPKANGSKAKKDKTKASKGANKNATLLAMLSGNGSSVEQLTKALEWLPHTLRARISRLSKSKAKGGEGLKIERQRIDGVTTYRIA